MRILIVEDDDGTARHLQRGLVESGHVVDRTADGESGLGMALEGIYDLLIVDRLVPALNGVDLIKAFRQTDAVTPVLMLSAIAGMRDRVSGLVAGADDYLGKPFSFGELLARIEALARRADQTRRRSILEVADLRVDTSLRRAWRGDVEILLRHREFLLLEKLLRHAGQIVTRAMLLEAGWPYDFEPRGNIVDMHIHRLRQKIDKYWTPLIRTIPGAGYIILTDDEPEEL
ncbi:two component transcriptional regulator, winged helix family [Arboricoccus pini]|uniref:Two component transcriptional regulator, winged helix family n=1 Tax=Arboricoccus pini TaxID=1963835 RepID=A0A212R3P8_9PROT|nr:response regulator transcription factor [Arboricoccus pini]SNB66620.1 two component transcriptional regulator, winged helix family [Arboricoccus pini]